MARNTQCRDRALQGSAKDQPWERWLYPQLSSLSSGCGKQKLAKLTWAHGSHRDKGLAADGASAMTFLSLFNTDWCKKLSETVSWKL